MTLQELINRIGQNPDAILFFFIAVPLVAFLVGWLAPNEGHLPPWKYIYSTLVYLACVPGVFAIALNAYLFLFERRSIFAFDVYTQILPIFAMLLTLWLIRRAVLLEYIPGFQKLSGLVIMIFASLAIMWIVDRTRIMVFSYLPFQYVLGIFTVLLALMLWGWKSLFGR
jgi:hypothetical protein